MSLREYITRLGGADLIIQKSEKLQSVANILCPERITDFFISEVVKDDGQRIFTSLWFLSPKHMLECKKILAEEFNIDVACIYKSIERCEMTYVEYDPLDPQATTDRSRLSIEGNIGMIDYTFKASKDNCSKLWHIFECYLKPNLVKLVDIRPIEH
jgi:hypothetical protein